MHAVETAAECNRRRRIETQTIAPYQPCLPPGIGSRTVYVEMMQRVNGGRRAHHHKCHRDRQPGITHWLGRKIAERTPYLLRYRCRLIFDRHNRSVSSWSLPLLVVHRSRVACHVDVDEVEVLVDTGCRDTAGGGVV